MMLFNAVNLVMEKDVPVDSSFLIRISLSILVLFSGESFLAVIGFRIREAVFIVMVSDSGSSGLSVLD